LSWCCIERCAAGCEETDAASANHDKADRDACKWRSGVFVSV
jgi:hypothetical protein